MDKGINLDVNKLNNLKDSFKNNDKSKLAHKKKITTQKKAKSTPKSNRRNKQNSGYHKQPGFGYLQFVTLKIIFIDLAVQLGDLGSDFAQVEIIERYADQGSALSYLINKH